MIWSWQNFRKEYQILGHLKNVFLTIPMCLLYVIVIPNILKYIQVSLKFFPLSRIYKHLLNWPNLTYIVSLIYKTGFKDLDFLIPSGGVVGKIQKIMIFVDKIDAVIQMTKHLYSRLLKRIRREKRPNHIIHIFIANLTTTSRTQFLADLYLGKTRISICIEYASMGINLPDIHRAISFKISDCIMLLELLQRLGSGGRDTSRIAVAIAFVETWQILSNNMHTLEGNPFKDLWLPITCENRDQTTDVIARLYCKYISLNMPKTGNSYQKTDLSVLWFLNTTSCWRQIVLAYFIYKMAFDDKIDCENCCDNCIYNRGKVG